MDAECLRKACELAGMDVREGPGIWGVKVDGLLLKSNRKKHLAWIESRCASVLVGMVDKPGTYCVKLEELTQETSMFGPAFATDEQRIRAAYYAITGEEL